MRFILQFSNETIRILAHCKITGVRSSDVMKHLSEAMDEIRKLEYKFLAMLQPGRAGIYLRQAQLC